MVTINQISRVHSLIYKHLCTILPEENLSYDRITDAFILLADLVDEYESDDNSSLWAIGEFTLDLPEMLVGAYWHFSEWHAGQTSKSYQALCAIGNIYEPNMDTVDPDNMIYQELDKLCDLCTE